MPQILLICENAQSNLKIEFHFKPFEILFNDYPHSLYSVSRRRIRVLIAYKLTDNFVIINKYSILPRSRLYTNYQITH